MTDGEPRQRWRLSYRVEREAALPQRQALDAWRRSLLASGLPLAREAGDPERPRLGFPPPLPVGMVAEDEVLDLYLTERLPQAVVRARLASVLPPGHRLLGLRDVWVGAPPLAGQVVAADYRIVLEAGPEGGAAMTGPLHGAIRQFLAAPSWIRPHRKDPARSYDLRPLVADLRLDEVGDGLVLRARLRVDPTAGAGRPEAVLEALAEVTGRQLAPRGPIVREHLWLADERPLPLGSPRAGLGMPDLAPAAGGVGEAG
jgi:radical SAM-linked protein